MRNKLLIIRAYDTLQRNHLKKTNTKRTQHKEYFSQESVELGDKPSTRGTSTNYPN